MKKIIVPVLLAIIFSACGGSLKEKANESKVFEEPRSDQAYLDSVATVKAYNDSIYFAGPKVAIITSKGKMVFKLYDKTPKHRDNFIKLANSNYYVGLKFHRVLKDFMVQGGDPNSRDNDSRDDGLGGPGYTIPAEFFPRLIHKRGALCAAREGDGVNPKRESSGSQFYIVDGRNFSLNDNIFYQVNTPKADREIYSTVGGTPDLDRSYTVFEELIDGYGVMESIAGAKTKANPLDPASLSVPVEPIIIQKVEMIAQDTIESLPNNG